MSTSSTKNHVVDLSNHVPPRNARALRTIFPFFNHSQIVKGMPSASRKRHNVIEFVLSGIEFLSRFALPVRYHSAANVCGNSSIRLTRPGLINHKDAENDDPPCRRTIKAVGFKNQVLDEAGYAAGDHPLQIENAVMSARPNTGKVSHSENDPDYPKDIQKRRGIAVHFDLPPKGKFGSGLVSPAGAGYVNGVTLAVA
ncbi:MAG: hypothetical protein WCA19_14740 [Candidatus Acidiferrales bacterium]